MLVEKTHKNLIKKEAEQSILGSMLLDNNIAYLLENLSNNDFYFEQHRIIYDSMLNLYKNKTALDFVTVVDSLREKNKLEEAGGMSYITSLSTIVPTTSNVEYYMKIVKEAAEKRKIISYSYDLIKNLEEGKDVDSSLAVFENATKLKEQLNEDESLKAIIGELFDELNSGKKENKIKTGITVIDKATNGIATTDLVAIGGASGLGKSAIALRIALNMHLENKKVLIISREMSKKELGKRIILSETGISKEKFEERNFNENEWKQIINVMTHYSTENILIDDTTKTVSGIKRKLRSFNPDLIIVDYVQLLSPSDSKENRERQVARMSNELKNITLDFHIPVIQLTQLADKGKNYRPSGETYVRESRAIYHDSNIVVYLHNPTLREDLDRLYNKKEYVWKEKKDRYGNEVITKETIEDFLESKKEKDLKVVEIIVDKNRNGRQMSNYYWFDGKMMRYIAIS